MKPLLAYTVESIETVRFPVFASPKLDGIRCLILDGVAVSRTLKPIPNAYIRHQLAGLPPLDGELICGDPTDPDCFNRTTSAVMSRDGAPAFTFRVFDHFGTPTDHFPQRLFWAGICVSEALGDFRPVEMVRQDFIRDAAELADYEAAQVALGYEGVMIRDPEGLYKFGRSTAKEGILGKVKRFADAEAEVVGIEELYRNGNAAEVNALGHTERSTAAAGLVPAGTLGALIVRAEGFAETFKIGTGYTAAQRDSLWADRASLPGRLVKFKHQPAGAKDAPRFPVFLGFRLD